ncbi:hypothetical protein SPI_05579 [Niveomyces insectorum RCEF 264]|uniref:Uncharacterized protein n=1 Tax=Niveomyces insectorum RCEF 264 TaxID=1081102 RepID=A0A167TCH6_9HYPO|nr:hypothetical protein SPI_05579 [Niveomyces insectorum RCEF 264]
MTANSALNTAVTAINAITGVTAITDKAHDGQHTANTANDNDTYAKSAAAAAAVATDPFAGLRDRKLARLRKTLDEDATAARVQRKNIEFLIRYYENGGRVPQPGETIWLVDGRIVPERPKAYVPGAQVWPESGLFYQHGQFHDIAFTSAAAIRAETPSQKACSFGTLYLFLLHFSNTE